MVEDTAGCFCIFKDINNLIVVLICTYYWVSHLEICDTFLLQVRIQVIKLSNKMSKCHKQRAIINLISDVGNTNQRMGKHGPLDVPQAGSGA
jgi:hypothetical protein